MLTKARAHCVCVCVGGGGGHLVPARQACQSYPHPQHGADQRVLNLLGAPHLPLNMT